ncbi:MAG: integrase [Methylomonas sp.]|nr:MAG: integrase [Methylomonas sp.]
MKVTIEKRVNKTGDKQNIRLVYWYGSHTDEDGKLKHNRKREQLDQFLYVNPKSKPEQQHNKDTLALVEAIRAKRITEAASSEHGFISPNKQDVRFYQLFDAMMNERKTFASKTSHNLWRGCREQVKKYWPDEQLLLKHIDEDALKGLKRFLETEAKTKTGQSLKKATSNTYFNKVRSVIKKAFDRGHIKTNLLADIKNIKIDDQERVYLSIDEVRQLVATECRYDVLKRAFLFSCLTGLRWSDVFKLDWSDVGVFNGVQRITFTHKKTNQLQYLDITEQAFRLMGVALTSGRVFQGLRYSANSNIELLRWSMAAGINKHVTFHAARHTFAVSLLSNGVDIYTVSKLLGHTQIKTTQIYSDIIDEVRKDAVHRIPSIGI